jgi:pyrroline-5-carboxylate reductase
LRQKVATKGGTTAAAFEALLDEKNGLTSLMTKAVEKATKRSKELGNS